MPSDDRLFRPDPDEGRRVTCRLNKDAVNERMKRRKLTQAQIAKELGVEKRTLEYWIAGRRRRGPTSPWQTVEPTVEQAQCLAQVLGVGIEEIACWTDGEQVAEERALAEGGFAAWATTRGKRKAFDAVIVHAQKFFSYARHISLRFWPLRGYARRFFHDGKIKYTYATICVKPLSMVESADFIFSFCLGPARIDYGAVELRHGHELMVRPYFAAYDSEGVTNRDGSFRVRTWFGPEECHFVVRCREVDFELEPPKVIPGQRDHTCPDPDVITFVAAPHHLDALAEASARST